MLIAADIGNSSINIGYFTEAGLYVQIIPTHPAKRPEGYRLLMTNFISEKHIEKKLISCIISSVVISHTDLFRAAMEGLYNKLEPEVLLVSHRMNSGLKFRIPFPEKFGTDRIADAVGACNLYSAPVAVVNCGTATTITVVDEARNIIGGSIMPGLGMMKNSLEKGTSKLAGASLETPAAALGKDTQGCISSGIYIGTAGAAERIISEIEEETFCRYKIVITGGYGHMIAKFIKRPYDINVNLTLEGLRILYEQNRTS